MQVRPIPPSDRSSVSPAVPAARRKAQTAFQANLRFYEGHVEEFAEQTQHLILHEVYAPFLDLLPKRARILDAGCGSARDAAAFAALGYRLQAIDSSPAMVQMAKQRQIPAEVMKFQEMTYQKKFDGLWACASLLHIPRIEINRVLDRFLVALKPRGILFASLKEGHGERIVEDGRFFSYYELDEFTQVLKRSSWRVIRSTRTVGADGRVWLNYLAQRPTSTV